MAVFGRRRLHYRYDARYRRRQARGSAALCHRREGQLMTQIDSFLSNWTAAERAGDTAALDALLTDDFVGVGPLGFTLPKSAWLARHMQGGLTYETFDLEETLIRLHGDAAL